MNRNPEILSKRCAKEVYFNNLQLFVDLQDGHQNCGQLSNEDEVQALLSSHVDDNIQQQLEPVTRND